jgi:hypothetical protein
MPAEVRAGDLRRRLPSPWTVSLSSPAPRARHEIDTFLISPGSQHQRFFDTLGDLNNAQADAPPLTEPPDVERLVTVGEACGIHFMPPP